MCDLQWRQPRAYRRALAREFRPKNPMVNAAMWPTTLSLFVMIGGSFWLELHLSALSWSVFVVCALGVSYVLCRLSFLALARNWNDLTVVLSAEGVQSFWFLSIGRVPGELFPWERIGRCRAVLEEIGGKRFPVLIVESWEGRKMAKFGLAERPSLAEIRDWLKGIDRDLSDETRSRGQGSQQPVDSATGDG